MKRNAFVAIVSAFLLFSSIESACFSEQVAIDDTKATPLALTVRFPELRGFVIPKTAVTMDFSFLCGTSLSITRVAIYEARGNEIPDAPLAENSGSQVAIDRLQGKTIFAFVTVAAREGTKVETPMLNVSFMGPRGDVLRPATHHQVTGWVSCGGNVGLDFIFRADSPILSFRPILRNAKSDLAVGDVAAGAAEIVEADSSFQVLKISPFTTVVSVPAMAREMELSADLELCDNFSGGGTIYSRQLRSTTPATPILYEVIDIELPDAPAKTRKVIIHLNQSYGIAAVCPFIRFPSSYRLDLAFVSVAASGAAGTAGEGKYTETLDLVYDLHVIPAANLAELDAASGKLTVDLQMNPFLCDEKERAAICNAIRSVEFLDDKGAKLR